MTAKLQPFSLLSLCDLPLLSFHRHSQILNRTRSLKKSENTSIHPYRHFNCPTTTAMSDPLLFEDTFTITAINSQKYDRVSRLSCTSSDSFTTFTLDVNTEMYPCTVGESISMALASTLSLDGKEDSKASWREVGMGEQTLANDYDYVCHGKAYRFEEGSTQGNM